jgi:methyl-accepting chemotaxis protein
VKILGELRAQANGVRRATLRHLLETDKAGKDAQASAHDDFASTKLPATLATYEKLVGSAEETRLYERIKSGWNAYLEQDKKLIALSNKGADGFDEARQLSTGPSAASFTAVMKAIEEDVELNASGASASSDAAAVSYRRVLWINLVSIGLAVLSGIGLGIVMTRSITRPIQQAVELAGAVAEGDLTSRIEVQGKDEAAQLLRSLSRMNDSLTRIVGQVRNSSDSIATGSAQIATGNQDLSQRTEEQASNLQQTAASMEQISGTVRNNSETAITASKMATQACASAVKGGQVVGTVVATMQDIAASSKKIADIIGVIDGIAFQTNILALNAAVEAARAGEQGRGFAVVAGEVRTLASRSAEAAKEIKSLIGASVDKVELGARQVNEAGASMDDIVSEVQRVTQLISEISSATAEQATGISQVGDAVNQLDQVTQQNAALVEESAAAADSLRQQAASLAEVVSVFKLGNAGGHGLRLASGDAANEPVAVRSAAARQITSAARANPKARQQTATATTDQSRAHRASAATSPGADNWETF